MSNIRRMLMANASMYEPWLVEASQNYNIDVNYLAYINKINDGLLKEAVLGNAYSLAQNQYRETGVNLGREDKLICSFKISEYSNTTRFICGARIGGWGNNMSSLVLNDNRTQCKLSLLHNTNGSFMFADEDAYDDRLLSISINVKYDVMMLLDSIKVNNNALPILKESPKICNLEMAYGGCNRDGFNMNFTFKDGYNYLFGILDKYNKFKCLYLPKDGNMILAKLTS